MTTNQIGIRNSNVIVPYTAATKQSKIMDISSYVTGTGWTSANSAVQFHADSSGNWWMDLSITGTFSTGATFKTLSIAGITFKNGTNNWALSLVASGSAPYTGVAEATRNSNTIGLYATTSSTLFELSGNVPLASEPTWTSLGTTASAALEGVLPVDVYIPPASASNYGLLKTNKVQTISIGTVTSGATYTIRNLTSGGWYRFCANGLFQRDVGAGEYCIATITGGGLFSKVGLDANGAIGEVEEVVAMSGTLTFKHNGSATTFVTQISTNGSIIGLNLTVEELNNTEETTTFYP